MSILVACDFCGRDDTAALHTLVDIRKRLPGEYHLVRCKNCGLLYLNPQPTDEELALHYSENYHCFIQAIDDQAGKFTRWAQKVGFTRRIRLITTRIPKGNLLDVGCGTGNFLNEVKRSGEWKVSGVETSAAAAEYARKRFGIVVFTGTLLDAQLPADRFQAITLWDVLEHTHQPQAYLSEIYRLLHPGGWVVLKSPDPVSWEARIFGTNWVGFEAPQHLYGFPPAVLIRKLSELGFQKITLTSVGGDYATFLNSLSLSLEARRHGRTAKVAGKLAGSTLSRVVSAPLFALLRMVGAGSSHVYLAQKPKDA